MDWQSSCRPDVLDTSSTQNTNSVGEITAHINQAYDDETERSHNRIENGTSNGGSLDKPELESSRDVDGEVEKKKKEKVNIFQLYKYANAFELFLLSIGALCAILQGSALQFPYLVIAQTIDDYACLRNASNESTPQATPVVPSCPKTLVESAVRVSVGISLCAVIIVVNYFLHVYLFTIVADRLTRRIRLLAFENILRQDIGFFDVHFGGELNTRLTQDVTKYEIGIGNKASIMISWIGAFLTGLIICLVKGWKLTLFMCILLPVAAVVSGVTTRLMKVYTEKEMAAYAKAGGVAEEALTNIRVVTAFDGQQKESLRYEKLLQDARKVGIKSALASSIGQGVPWFLTFTIASLTIFLTGKMISTGTTNPGFMFVLLGCMMQGLRALGFAAALLEYVFDSQGAAYGIYQIISAKTRIDSRNPKGQKLSEVKGHVTFSNIHFTYPARKTVEVLKGLSLKIKPGQSVALVGPSGCGKSTTIQLLQRFYDPECGTVKLDGVDLKDLNLSWLREQIGVVSQDPVLFATSIEENIRFGRPGASFEEIKRAAMEADAHEFINKLPEKYGTILNEQGTQLSRGEKQRISLARALVRRPKILLLDECTSALDNESEATVQAALDKASKGRTTIIIAHRLSTVRDCDVLFVVDRGVVVESGSHQELLAIKGVYHGLVSAQMVKTENTRCEGPSMFEFSEANDSDSDDSSSSSSFSRSSSSSSSASFRHLLRVFALNKSEWPLFLLGCLGGLALGATWPVFSLLLSHAIGVIVQVENVLEGVKKSSFGIFGLGCVSCFLCGMSIFMLKYFGESLTKNVRSMAYKSMLNQEIGWFDRPGNQVGSLTSRLAEEASKIKLATGNTLVYMSSAISSCVCSVLVALLSSWQLGLAVLPLMPLTICAGILQGYMNTSYERKSHLRVEASGKVASEAIDKIRTIASLTKEEYFLQLYTSHFDTVKKEARKRATIIGLSQSFVWFCSCSIEIVSVGFGMYLVSKSLVEFEIVFRILTVALVMASEVGRANANLPELASSLTSAKNFLKMLNRVPSIRSDNEGSVPHSDQCAGEVEFEGVHFSYPSRRERQVLNSFDLKVKKGQSVAIVGPSGSGKSTVVQLIERFYDVTSGSVRVDGVEVKNLNLKWLRSKLGIVLQEPILFGISLEENIAYGDNSRKVGKEEIIAAARSANIHDFISSLPEGYDTNVGSKGTQLSGGQKQRVSIARALLRNPPILLLDDATSALDSHSESIVEEALQNARSGRTSIVIAHRLSSIINADVILYVRKGKVIESGNHTHLMSIKGHYYDLYTANMGNKN